MLQKLVLLVLAIACAMSIHVKDQHLDAQHTFWGSKTDWKGDRKGRKHSNKEACEQKMGGQWCGQICCEKPSGGSSSSSTSNQACDESTSCGISSYSSFDTDSTRLYWR